MNNYLYLCQQKEVAMLIHSSVYSVTELINAAKTGSRHAFSELYRLYYQLVHRSLSLMSVNRNDLDDLTQETFLHAYLGINTLRQPHHIKAWLLAIARRRTHNYYRRHRREQHLTTPIELLAISHSLNNPLRAAIARDEHHKLKIILRRLKPTDLATLIDFYWRGQTIKDMARELRVPAGTIKRRLHVARHRLRRAYMA